MSSDEKLTPVEALFRKTFRGPYLFAHACIGLGIGLVVFGLVLLKIFTLPFGQKLMDLAGWPLGIGAAIYVLCLVLYALMRFGQLIGSMFSAK